MESRREDPAVYRAGFVREVLAERLGDLDIECEFVGDTLVVTGGVFSAEQRESVDRIVAEILPDVNVRNETTTPRVAEHAPPETVG